MMRKEPLRLMDANLNRSREGLRVCEDIARFILGSPALTKELKAVRHKISDIIKEIPPKTARLFESRDSRRDIGRRPEFEDRMTRTDCMDIFTANMERVKESLRVLEEFAKLFDSKIAVKFLVLRFGIYDIEKRSVKKIASLRNFR